MPLPAVAQTRAIGALTPTNLSDVLSACQIVKSDVAAAVTLASDLTIVKSQVLVVKSAASDCLSAVTIARSDTAHIESDCAGIQTAVAAVDAALTVAASDIVKMASDVLDVYSDTGSIAAVLSDTLKAESDLTAIEIATERSGTPTAKACGLKDDALMNNTQTAPGLVCTASGDVLIEQLIVEKDATLAAGPANVEFTTDNAYGLTGVDAPVAAVAVAVLTANSVQLGTAFAVTPLVPFVLENGKKLYCHGSNGVGTSAGYLKIVAVGRGLAAGAVLT
jgi:hypothetical protein